MNPEHDVALASILKGQRQLMQVLEDQAQQIRAIKGTLEGVMDELRVISEDREK